MYYYILILVNGKSSMLTAQNIINGLTENGFLCDEKTLSGRFDKRIVRIVVEKVIDADQTMQMIINGLSVSGKMKQWDIIFPYTELFNSKDMPKGTVELFTRIKGLLQLQIEVTKLDYTLPRIIYINDQKSNRNLVSDDFSVMYGYDTIRTDDSDTFFRELIDEIGGLVETRLPINLYNQLELSQLPDIRGNSIEIEEDYRRTTRWL